MIIYCCGCERDVEARMVYGKECYPHRADLFPLPFWRCDTCRNFVGCHHKSKEPTKPLGCIPTKEIKLARQKIHAELDPIWKSCRRTRGWVYRKISSLIGYEFHTANIRSIEEAQKILRAISTIK